MTPNSISPRKNSGATTAAGSIWIKNLREDAAPKLSDRRPASFLLASLLRLAVARQRDHPE